MLMKLLNRLGQNTVYVAGFDGYQEEKQNYVYSYMASQYTKGKDENRKIKKYISELKKKMDIYFLTDSIYEK